MIYYILSIWILGAQTQPHICLHRAVGTSSCVEQGDTPYDRAQALIGRRKVMGVLDPVPWRWDEHPLVDQGFGTRGL